MIVALARACAELFTPALRRIVALSLALAVASFVGLWLAVAALLHRAALFGWWPLDWLVDLLGAIEAGWPGGRAGFIGMPRSSGASDMLRSSVSGLFRLNMGWASPSKLRRR